jgi:TRAP transporter 4TM/12TM fusion protein
MTNEKPESQEAAGERGLSEFFYWLLRLLGVILACFTMYTGYTGPYEPFVQRGIFLSFPVFFTFILLPYSKRVLYQKGIPYYLDILLSLLGAIACLYVAIFNREMQARAGNPLMVEIALGTLLILLLFEAGRRSIGLALPIITGVMIIYTYFGPYMPDLIAHRGADLVALAAFIYAGTEGIWGIPVAVGADYLFLFVLFGALMVEAKVGDLILDLAFAAAGHARGGPAKLAVVSSAFFGTISGASVANVVATGSFTIPLMKKAGYPAYYAGAIEAVASTGGVIMPPVMGAAAFIMADLMGVNYFQVVKAAVLPAVLYYIGLFAMVHLKAIKLGLQPFPGRERQRVIRDMMARRGYMLLPAVVIVWFLIVAKKSPGLSAFYANLAGIGVVFVNHWIGRDLRKIPAALISACFRAAKIMVMVAVPCALAGVIIGCSIQSGLAIHFSTVLTSVAGDSLWLLLFMAMVASFILGMGVTAAVAYIIPAILVVPTMIKMGVSPMAANMFCLYFAVISYITPPVALAAYAAAGIASSNPFQTGYTATRLGIAAYILPYMFVFEPTLILEGNLVKLLITVPTAILGMVLLAAALEGWLLLKLGIFSRILLVAGAFSLIKPGVLTDFLGIAVFAVLFIYQYQQKNKRAPTEKRSIKPIS